MAELKTKINNASVTTFINKLKDKQTIADCNQLITLMQKATGTEPKMWGASIVGFGSYHFKYASGREGDWMLIGFSPRKQNLTLYIMPGFAEYEDLLTKLGKHSIGKSCLYIKKLDDINLKTLNALIVKSVKHMKKTNS